MAGRKGAGTAPLGHSPFSKVKLEGPKKEHDFHGKDDSVPNKKVLGKEHWEHHYDATGASKNMHLVEGADFNPKCAYERKTTHIKVNECDH
jgi:hypothetical protein